MRGHGWLCSKGHFTPDTTDRNPAMVKHGTRCRECYLAKGRRKQSRYRFTAKGILTEMRDGAKNRGT